ncbi:MAG: FkbM family methyltransferase [Pseudomonadota bacterium]
MDKSYDLRPLSRFPEFLNLLAQIRSLNKRPLIIDAGANIGISCIYFCAQIRDAVVVAIEPETDNYTILRENVRNLPVIPVRAALSSAHNRVKVVNPDAGFWGFRTESTDDTENSVDTVTIPEILAAHEDTCSPFIVKIDIEGYEEHVFRENFDWIDHIPILIVELHDWLYPKNGTSKTFLKAIADRDRDFINIGENIFSIRNNLNIEV